MNTQSDLNLALHPVTAADCHQHHQYWQGIIYQQATEIQQLRSLLQEVMNLYNYRSLRHNALDYYQDLNRLQTKLDQLTRDLLCEDCKLLPRKLTCDNSRFTLSAMLEHQATSLLGEFSRIKEGCLQFLSGMMSMNLL